MPYRITTTSRIAGSRNRISGCGSRFFTALPRPRRGSSAAARTFETRLRHLADVQEPAQHRLRDSAFARELTDRAAGADRFFGNLRRLVVADGRGKQICWLGTAL